MKVYLLFNANHGYDVEMLYDFDVVWTAWAIFSTRALAKSAALRHFKRLDPAVTGLTWSEDISFDGKSWRTECQISIFDYSAWQAFRIDEVEVDAHAVKEAGT